MINSLNQINLSDTDLLNMTDLTIYSPESVMLDLDSNLSFENISWINEDFFRAYQSEVGDHTYSQSGDQNVETMPGLEALENSLGDSFCIEEITNGNPDMSIQNTISGCSCNISEISEDIEPTSTVSEIALDEPKQMPTDQLVLQTSENCQKEIQPSDTGHEKQPPASGRKSSLSYLLEETSLDIDLDSLLQEDSLFRSEADLMRLDLDNLEDIGDKNNFTTLNDLNHSLKTIDNCSGQILFESQTMTHLNFLSPYDRESGSVFNSSTDWSSVSTTSTVGETALDWTNSDTPLSLEELFTRTFNEEVQKGQLPTQSFSDDNLLSNDGSYLSNYFQFDTITELSDGRHYMGDGIYNESLESLESSQDTSSGIFNVGESCPAEIADSHQNNLPLPSSPETSVSTTKYKHTKRSEHNVIGNEHRLAQVRKYQRVHNKSDSENLVRNFQCSYPECLKFYAKLSHLKAHLRRHSGERSFKCDWQDCSWQFSRSDELSRHRRSHYGIKPYPCTICVKKFTRSDHLAKHLKVHERQKYKMMMKTMRKIKTKK